MKLAEALQERAYLQQNIAQLKNRINACATVQEGETPAENPSELIKELNEKIDRLNTIISSVNKTNCETIVEGKSITEWIAERDVLKIKIDCYIYMIEPIKNLNSRIRVSQTEIKIIGTLDVKQIQHEIDMMSKRLRLVENTIQQYNWLTEIDL